VSTLEIVNGKSAGVVVDLMTFDAAGVTLGKRRKGIQIKDPWISFSHAVISRDGATFVIADKRSKAGTFVNGTKIGRNGTVLKGGDLIALGKTELRFSAGGASAPAAASAAAAAAAPAPAPAASSSPFTPHASAPAASSSPFTSTASSAPAPSGDSQELKRAQADLKSLRTAIAQRDQELARAKKLVREMEAGGGDPEVAKKLKEADSKARQAEHALQSTTSAGRIRIEELTRLNTVLEQRLAQAGAGQLVSQEKEVTRLREEGRKLQEDARARLQEVNDKNAALEAELKASGGAEAELNKVQEASSTAIKRSAELEELLELAKSDYGQLRGDKENLEFKIEDLEEKLKKLAKAAEEIGAMETTISKLTLELSELKTELMEANRKALAAGPAAAAAATAAPAPADSGKLDALEAEVASLKTKLAAAEKAAAAVAGAPVAAAPAAAADPGAAAKLAELESKLEAAEKRAAEAEAAPAAPAGGGDDAAAQARIKELEQENEGLLKDLEEINEDMLAQEEEYMERIQELEEAAKG
jgi:pilus assembly protein FimV